MTMGDFDAQYGRLNAAQKRAVDTIDGPVVVVAGPGTGKTQILTLRIANILRTAGAGIGPENILALTFTTAGVAAMRRRLATFIGAADAYRTHIFTFHGFCEQQIADHPDYFPHIAYARPAAAVERLDIVARVVRDGDFAKLKTFISDTYAVKDIAAAINEIKNAGMTPEAFVKRVDAQHAVTLASAESYYKRNGKNYVKGDLKPDALRHVEKNRELARVYAAYQEALRATKIYDFADMIVDVVRAMETQEGFAATVREQYQYILVDEHQDTNDGQNRLLELLLASPYEHDAPNIFTVGDEKQAIYRFQGASVENFQYFKKRYPQTTVIDLDTNYRATQDLLDEAHAMITRAGTDASHTPLVAHTDATGRTRVLRYRTRGDEIRGIVEDVRARIAEGVAPDAIAVFAYVNNDVRDIAHMCDKMHIPCVIGGARNILDNPLVRSCLRLLAAIDMPTDDDRFAAALVSPLSGVPLPDALALLNRYRVMPGSKTLYEYARDARWCTAHDVPARAIGVFAKNITQSAKLAQQVSLPEFVEHVMRTSGAVEYAATRRDSTVQLRDCARLVEEVASLVQRQPESALADVVAYYETCARYGVSIDAGEPADVSGVHLMTAHSAKGLEFDHVYIAHAVHKVWGGRRSPRMFHLPIDTVAHDDDDDRRLFYVAMTRARKSLTITLSQYDKNAKEVLQTEFVDYLRTRIADTEPAADVQADFAPRLRPIVSPLDPHYIRDRFLSTPLSVTAMNNYFRSPLLYFFRTIVQLPSVPTKSLLFGNVIHGTLEQFARAVISGTVPTEEETVALFHRQLRRAYVPRVYMSELAAHGERVVRGYYAEHAATFVPPQAVEQRVVGVPFTLRDGREITLTGAIDKITATSDGAIVVTDYKTGRAWSDKHDTVWRDGLERQIRFYKLLLKNDPRAPHPPMAYGEIDFVEPRKNGAYETYRITPTDDDLSALTEEINAMAEAVLSGSFADMPLCASNEPGKSSDIAYYARLLEEMRAVVL